MGFGCAGTLRGKAPTNQTYRLSSIPRRRWGHTVRLHGNDLDGLWLCVLRRGSFLRLSASSRIGAAEPHLASLRRCAPSPSESAPTTAPGCSPQPADRTQTARVIPRAAAPAGFEGRLAPSSSGLGGIRPAGRAPRMTAPTTAGRISQNPASIHCWRHMASHATSHRTTGITTNGNTVTVSGDKAKRRHRSMRQLVGR